MMTYKSHEAIQRIAHERNTVELAKKVLALQTSDKFRLAAELLDAGKVASAEAVGMRACQEIQRATLFGPRGEKGS